jgi:hypothetical protein
MDDSDIIIKSSKFKDVKRLISSLVILSIALGYILYFASNAYEIVILKSNADFRIETRLLFLSVLALLVSVILILVSAIDMIKTRVYMRINKSGLWLNENPRYGYIWKWKFYKGLQPYFIRWEDIIKIDTFLYRDKTIIIGFVFNNKELMPKNFLKLLRRQSDVYNKDNAYDYAINASWYDIDTIKLYNILNDYKSKYSLSETVK